MHARATPLCFQIFKTATDLNSACAREIFAAEYSFCQARRSLARGTAMSVVMLDRFACLRIGPR